MPNNNHGIQIHNFQNAKNGLKKFSKNIPSSPNLPTVETDGGIFGWFDHKVTGSELNKLTKNVQSFLIATNNQQIKVIKEFEQVYETFECLDKDYIQGILLGIEAAKKASDQAQEAAEKAIETSEKAKEHTYEIKNLSSPA
jgi:flagellar hook assembly protein FlgD